MSQEHVKNKKANDWISYVLVTVALPLHTLYISKVIVLLPLLPTARLLPLWGGWVEECRSWCRFIPSRTLASKLIIPGHMHSNMLWSPLCSTRNVCNYIFNVETYSHICKINIHMREACKYLYVSICTFFIHRHSHN